MRGSCEAEQRFSGFSTSRLVPDPRLWLSRLCSSSVSRGFMKLSIRQLVAAVIFVFALAHTQAALAQRGASCHNGASFDRFLAELKQQAATAGVSQRALAEA